MITLREFNLANGNIEVHVGNEKLTCPVCQAQQFHERNSLLPTRAAAFFNFEYVNKGATNYICVECGYIFWFMAP